MDCGAHGRLVDAAGRGVRARLPRERSQRDVLNLICGHHVGRVGDDPAAAGGHRGIAFADRA